jgi:hypothetical protein
MTENLSRRIRYYSGDVSAELAALMVEAADELDRLEAFETICLGFKRRVEAGEVRSVRTYNLILRALGE